MRALAAKEAEESDTSGSNVDNGLGADRKDLQRLKHDKQVHAKFHHTCVALPMPKISAVNDLQPRKANKRSDMKSGHDEICSAFHECDHQLQQGMDATDATDIKCYNCGITMHTGWSKCSPTGTIAAIRLLIIHGYRMFYLQAGNEHYKPYKECRIPRRTASYLHAGCWCSTLNVGHILT